LASRVYVSNKRREFAKILFNLTKETLYKDF